MLFCSKSLTGTIMLCEFVFVGQEHGAASAKCLNLNRVGLNQLDERGDFFEKTISIFKGL